MLYGTVNPHGGDIYGEKITLDFSANTNPLGTPRGVTDAIKLSAERIDRYPDPYFRELVEAISLYENIPKEFILCGNGAAELIYSYCAAVKVKNAVVFAPTFSEYSLALSSTGCIAERYYLSRDNNFDPDDGFSEYLEKRQPEVVFMCNPNNPTGRLIPDYIVKKVLDLSRRTGTRIFLDECFLNLTDRGTDMSRYLEFNPQLLILKAFTKAYGMAGVRLGYAMCSDRRLLSEMAAASQPWNVSLPAQIAGVAALKEEKFLEETKAIVSEERRWIKYELEKLGFQVCPSDANFLLFYGKPGLDTQLKEYGIAVRNCSNYPGLGPGWYRTAVRLHNQNEQLISAVRKICIK